MPLSTLPQQTALRPRRYATAAPNPSRGVGAHMHVGADKRMCARVRTHVDIASCIGCRAYVGDSSALSVCMRVGQCVRVHARARLCECV